jgi:hypothetical protein
MSSNRNVNKRSSVKTASSNEHHVRDTSGGSRHACGKVSKRRQSDPSERQRVSLAVSPPDHLRPASFD